MIATQLDAQETKLSNPGASTKPNIAAAEPICIQVEYKNCKDSNVEKTKCRSTPTAPKTTVIRASKLAEPVIQEVNVNCTSQDAYALPKNLTPPNKNETDYSKLLEAFAKLLASIAWPISAVVIAYHFKNELAALLTRLKKVKAGSAEAEFERHISEVIETSDIKEAATPVSSSTRAAATSDPRGAILAAWLEVEKALFDLFDASGLNVPAIRPMRGILPAFKAIQKAGLLDSDYISLFHDLRTLRNDAAHNIEFNPSSDAVIQYTQLAKVLTKALQDRVNALN